MLVKFTSPFLFLLTCAFSTFSNAQVSQQGVRFVVDKRLQDRVSRDVIEYRIDRWVSSNNKIFKENGIAIERIPVGYSVREFDQLGGGNLHQFFNQLGRDAELRSDLGVNSSQYTVFMMDSAEGDTSCSVASSKSAKSKYAVVVFDLAGVCSFDYMMMHEIGHNDGLFHDGNKGGGRCPDGSFSVMSTSWSYGRRHLFGAENCPSFDETLDTPYSVYKRMEKALDGSVVEGGLALRAGYEFDVQAYSFNGLSVFFKPTYLSNFKRELKGSYYLAFPEDSSLVIGRVALIKLKRVKGGLTGKLSLSQKHSFLRAFQQRKVHWVQEK